MSANYVVDLGQTTLFVPSVIATPTSPLSGIVTGGTASGAFIGTPVDLLHVNSLTNVKFVGGPFSGVIVMQVQTAAAGSGFLQSGGGWPISGNFTDPTSGLTDFPGPIKSGGLVYINSGLVTLPGGGGASGGMNIFQFGAGLHPVYNGQCGLGFTTSGTYPVMCSGGEAYASLQRPDAHRFGRVNLLSGAAVLPTIMMAGFQAQLRTTGSGGGFAYNPSTGTVNV